MAARYDAGRRLKLAQGYERLGQVWSDVQLFDRPTLIDMLWNDKRVETGEALVLSTDFRCLAPVELKVVDGDVWLLQQGRDTAGDDLGLPLF